MKSFIHSFNHSINLINKLVLYSIIQIKDIIKMQENGLLSNKLLET